MSNKLRILAAGLSDRGLKRSHNEDSLSVVPDLGLFLVADGMGGHSAGEVASRQAIETIVEYIRENPLANGTAPKAAEPEDSTNPGDSPTRGLSEVRVSEAIALANRDVHRLAEDHSEFHGMGTTIVSMLMDPTDGAAAIAHVGDSRCYRLREGRLEQLTLDHSWVSEQLQKKIITPEEAKNHRWKNVITRALGHRDDVDVDVQLSSLAPGDMFLLCTDGLSGLVEDDQIARILVAHPDLEECAQELIRAANENGGHDNISIVIIRILDENA